MLRKAKQSADSRYAVLSKALYDTAELGEACDGLAEELFESEFIV